MNIMKTKSDKVANIKRKQIKATAHKDGRRS